MTAGYGEVARQGLLPSIDNVSIGLPEIYENEFITITELQDNKDDIWLSEPVMTVLKGSETSEGIVAVSAPSGECQEAEVCYSHAELPQLNQAIVHVSMAFGINFCESLGSGGEMGEFTCVAVTAEGEIPVYDLGLSDGYGDPVYRFLLPSATQKLCIRWRFPAEGEFIAAAKEWGEMTAFCNGFSQPGYGEEPGLGFELDRLTGDYGAFKADQTVPLSYVDEYYFSSGTAYDLDGDGVTEWLYDGCLYKFNSGMTGDDLVKKDFGKVLAFTGVATGDDVVGYDDKSIFSVDRDYNRHQLYGVDGVSPRFALIDYDNNGNIDFLNLNDNTVVSFDADGKPVTGHLSTMTREEYYNITPPESNPLGSGLSIITDPKVPAAVFASYIQTDINGDGFMDFVDSSTGNYYMNLGDGRYVTDSFRGSLLFRDFDGDGINDFLLYDPKAKSITVYLQRIGGDAVVRKLISGFYCSDDIWCRDFDGDGDVDILVPFNAEDNQGSSFLVMFENDGKGSFKKKEYVMEGGLNFRQCVDWNADGRYEVLTDIVMDRQSYQVTVGKIGSYAIEGLKVVSEPEYIFSDYKNLPPYASSEKLLDVADFDNSGVPRLRFSRYMITPDAPANTRPECPEAPAVILDPSTGILTVTWGRGKDKETSAADLSYELRIGTTPGSGDILKGSATAEGLRRDLKAGNCGYALMRKFDTASWPLGKIYVSLQTVDDSGLGSEFSAAAVFTKEVPGASFVIEAPDGVAVYEEFPVKITSPLADGYTVSWEVDGGEIVNETTYGINVRFTTPGEKTLKMTVSAPTGAKSEANRVVKVNAVRFEAVKDMPAVSLAIDLDLDGKQEVFAEGYFFAGDEAGNYTKINRIYNTKYYSGHVVADINGDGLPDVIHSGGFLLNEGDKGMDAAVPDGFKDGDYIPDLNNDGNRELYADEKILNNTGDYVNFLPVSGDISSPYYTHYRDVNGDGLIDILQNESSYWYENMGNFEFVKREYPMPEDSYCYSALDFDCDGTTDYLCRNGEKVFFILWGDGTQTELGKFEKYRAPDYDKWIFDFDNNGCWDIVIHERHNDSWGYTIVLLNPDHSFSTVEVDKWWYYNSWNRNAIFYRTDGKVGMRSNIVHCAPNEVPGVPGNVRATVADGHLLIEWEDAADKETPAAGMRYNISVRHKDAEGEGAYLISPLNGGVDGVNLPTDAQLVSATRYAIPLISVPKGEYEIKVQAVDGRFQTGGFSNSVYCEVNSAGYLAPKETMVGKTVAITFNADVKPADVDFGEDAVVESVTGHTAYVYWTSAGVKTVSANGLSFEITVHPPLDAFFIIPDQVRQGDTVYVACDTSHPGKWYVSEYSWGYWGPYNECVVEPRDKHTISLVLPFKLGTYSVKHEVTEPYGSTEYSTETKVITSNPAEIGIVDIDDATGKYCVRATATGEDVTAFMLYRETSETGEYEYLGELAGNGVYVDMDSDPKTHTSRYAVKNAYWYGESMMSKAHQPIHAIVGSGINSEWNISWTKYEGREATTYRVLRGTSPETLGCIAEVSGNTTSYSDYSYPEGTQYYAVETLINKPSAAAVAPMARSNDADVWRSRSNTVTASTTGLSEVEAPAAFSVMYDGRDIVVSGIPTDGWLRLFNMQGVCLYVCEVEAGVARISGNPVPDGIYVVTIVGKTGAVTTARFIKSGCR